MASVTSNVDIQLGPCRDLVHFQRTVDRLITLSNGKGLPVVTSNGLRFKEKGKMDKLTDFFVGGVYAPQITQKIIQFFESNVRWLVQIDSKKLVDRLTILPGIKGNSDALTQLSCIRSIAEQMKTQTPVSEDEEKQNQDHRISFMKLHRNDTHSMDLVFKASDGTVGAHKIFLGTRFKEDCHEVADSETIGLFLDIEYDTVDLQKFKDDSFGKLDRLAEHFAYPELTEKIVKILKQKLERREVSLLSVLPFIVNIPSPLFSHKLLDLIIFARDPKPAIDRMVFDTLQKSKKTPISLFLIGYCHYKFIGTPYSPDQAFFYFSKTSDLGLPVAIYYLGICHRDGIGTQQSIPNAFALISRATELGVPEAWMSLGHMYQHIKSRDYPEIPKDLTEAMRCYQEADRLGCSVAHKSLEHLGKNLLPPSPPPSLEKMVQDASGGDRDAMFLLAESYSKGTNSLQPNEQLALEWYTKASDLGHEQAAQKASALLDKQAQIQASIRQPILEEEGSSSSSAKYMIDN